MGMEATTHGLFEPYLMAGGSSYDEMRDELGRIRPHWRTFVSALESLPDLAQRWEGAQRMISENGVTYNVYAESAAATARPWPLDAVPLILSDDDWNRIETALQQRARLLDAVLGDLYGAQKLLSRKLLPPELVFAHTRFLRPCHGLKLSHWLYLYAADVARAPDGQLYVVKDRTQAPSGAGYALENRVVLGRALPELFASCKVRRLGRFFHALREVLAESAAAHRDNPRIVLLSPGPQNESYFEHAYLARHLGFGLVEGGDLTVRDNALWLKTRGGLQPIDVVLRYADDDLCDPLELRGDSTVGVPGLVSAARGGSVVIANALGSGLVQTAAVCPFLPSLCRHLLGEELALPSVESWWCGDENSLRHVEANLHRLVIKPAYPMPGVGAVFGEQLSSAERQALLERLRAQPHGFVAQRQIDFSTAPLLVGESPQARHCMLRVYAAASRDGYVALAGGMTRVSHNLASLVVSLQQGGGSKDTWVVSDQEPEESSALLPAAEHAVELTRGGSDLPSRLAENLYWLGRYVERTEGLVRLLRSILVRLLDHQSTEQIPEVAVLTHALLDDMDEALRPPRRTSWAEVRDDVLSLAFDADKAGSLHRTLLAVERVAGRVRDRLSADTWRVLAGLGQDFASLPQPPTQAPLAEVLNLLRRLVISLAAFGGLAMENFTRGLGLRFMDSGRRLERAIHTLHLLSTMVTVSEHDTAVMKALLEVADSSMTYRQRYLATVAAAPVLDVLLCDESNPRSLAFQLAALEKHVMRFPQSQEGVGLPIEQRLVLAALTSVRLAEPQTLSMVEGGTRDQLRALLQRLDEQLPAISDVICQTHLSLAPPPHHVGSW